MKLELYHIAIYRYI